VTCTGGNGTGAGTGIVIVMNLNGGKYVCSDGIDNDNDGFIDAADPQCHTDGDANNPNSYVPTHYSESTGPNNGGGSPQCSDTIDNDGDGLIDAADPQCHTDGDANNPNSYVTTIKSEQGSIDIPCEVTNSCSSSNPIPTVKPECSDNIDNDEDGLIDVADPSCHTDFNASNSDSYNKSLNNEAALANVTPNKCQILDQYPLEFNDAEKIQLATLLRKFYLIAPNLKTADDNVAVYAEISKYKQFIKQVSDLTQTCYEETDNESGYEAFCNEPANKKNKNLCPKNSSGSLDLSALDTAYTGPKAAYGNPWFKDSDRGSYFNNSDISNLANSGVNYHYSGTSSNNSSFFSEITKGKISQSESKMLHDYEILLNVW